MDKRLQPLSHFVEGEGQGPKLVLALDVSPYCQITLSHPGRRLGQAQQWPAHLPAGQPAHQSRQQYRYCGGHHPGRRHATQDSLAVAWTIRHQYVAENFSALHMPQGNSDRLIRSVRPSGGHPRERIQTVNIRNRGCQAHPRQMFSCYASIGRGF